MGQAGSNDGADAINAGLYLAEGDCLNAAISAAAIVPVVGSAAVAARSADRARDAARAVDNISDAARGANHADEVADAARAGTRYGDEVATATGRQADEVMGAACSFSEDTLVATESGFVPIGELDVGEMVLAWNQALDSTDFYTVTAVWAHLDSTVVTLTIDGEQIETTPEHPFYIADNAWVAAGELWLGARVKRGDGGYGTVEAISVVEAPQVMYNLTVSTAHTYHVGEDGWLVHNDCNIVPTDLHPFGNTRSPRPPRTRDIQPDPETGMVPAQTPPLPDGASTFGDPNQAPLKGHYHRLPEGTELPDGLGVVADGIDVIEDGHRPTHHTIYPTTEMTMDEFRQAFVDLPWEYAGRKRRR